MDCTTDLVIQADLNEIHRVSLAIDRTMGDCAFSKTAILDLQLAVEEAIVNTILHGYCGRTGELTIVIHATNENVEVRIEDHAPPFDPLSLPEPDRQSKINNRHIGGLGVFLMRNLVDEISHQYLEGKNILTFIKKKST